MQRHSYDRSGGGGGDGVHMAAACPRRWSATQLPPRRCRAAARRAGEASLPRRKKVVATLYEPSFACLRSRARSP